MTKSKKKNHKKKNNINKKKTSTKKNTPKKSSNQVKKTSNSRPKNNLKKINKNIKQDSKKENKNIVKNNSSKASNKKIIPPKKENSKKIKNKNAKKTNKILEFLSKIASHIKKFRISKRYLILLSILCLILALLIIYPYGTTNYKSEASGKVLDVPKHVKLKSECCMYNASFTSPRSAGVLKYELKTILKSYEKISCNGNDYYYNKDDDYTISEYNVKRGFLYNEINITYSMGNICEIDTTFRKIELIPNEYTLEDAIKEGYYTITDEGIKNEDNYNEFLKKIENKEESSFRIVRNNENGYLTITDLTYLDDGRFKVTFDGTRDPDSKYDTIIAFVYSKIGIYKDKLYAYNGENITKDMLKTSDVYYIMDAKVEE